MIPVKHDLTILTNKELTELHEELAAEVLSRIKSIGWVELKETVWVNTIPDEEGMQESFDINLIFNGRLYFDSMCKGLNPATVDFPSLLRLIAHIQPQIEAPL